MEIGEFLSFQGGVNPNDVCGRAAPVIQSVITDSHQHTPVLRFLPIAFEKIISPPQIPYTNQSPSSPMYQVSSFSATPFSQYTLTQTPTSPIYGFEDESYDFESILGDDTSHSLRTSLNNLPNSFGSEKGNAGVPIKKKRIVVDSDDSSHDVTEVLRHTPTRYQSDEEECVVVEEGVASVSVSAKEKGSLKKKKVEKRKRKEEKVKKWYHSSDEEEETFDKENVVNCSSPRRKKKRKHLRKYKEVAKARIVEEEQETPENMTKVILTAEKRDNGSKPWFSTQLFPSNVGKMRKSIISFPEGVKHDLCLTFSTEKLSETEHSESNMLWALKDRLMKMNKTKNTTTVTVEVEKSDQPVTKEIFLHLLGKRKGRPSFQIKIMLKNISTSYETTLCDFPVTVMGHKWESSDDGKNLDGGDGVYNVVKFI